MKKYIVCAIALIFCLAAAWHSLRPAGEKYELPLYAETCQWADLPQTKLITAALRLKSITKDACIAEVALKNVSDKTLVLDLYSIPINSYQNDFFTIRDLENGKRINYTGSFITPALYTVDDCVPIKSGQEIKLEVNLFDTYSGMKKIKALEIKYCWSFNYYEEKSNKGRFAEEKIESNSVYLYQWGK